MATKQENIPPEDQRTEIPVDLMQSGFFNVRQKKTKSVEQKDYENSLKDLFKVFDEDKKKFKASYDWNRMTMQDDKIWKMIFVKDAYISIRLHLPFIISTAEKR